MASGSARLAGARRDSLHRLPPLLSVAVAVLLALFVLPSSLNLPQTNPTQTLEYAPVPPSDDAPSQQGDIASLGLGSSSGVAGDATGGNGPGGLPDAAPPTGIGARPNQKHCVGSPPRQTEDQLAPPCVAYFDGDNFGATYQGVTKSEIRVLIYFDGGSNFADGTTSRGAETRPGDRLYDLSEPATTGEHVFVRSLRLFERFFNARFQTYNRTAHFYVYFSRGYQTPEARRSDAAMLIKKIRPFAVLGYAVGAEDEFLETMANAGVLNFGSLGNKPAAFFRKYPALVWSYLPSLEEQSRNYASFVCSEIVKRPVSFSGQSSMQGKPRKLGLLFTTDPEHPGYADYAKTAQQQIQKCGGNFVAQNSFPISRSCSGTGYTRGSNTAATRAAIASFQRQGVTTIIWPTGFEGTATRAAGQIGYLPEWVTAGDGYLDNYYSGQCQDQSVWSRHAMTLTPAALQSRVQDRSCYRAQIEVDPEFEDAGFICDTRSFYEDLRQLFTGIQVAGPRLNVKSIDEGFHAIPAVQSRDPHVPACFYRPNDYTCVKDMAAAWWDGLAQDANATAPGCWRLTEGGQRHFAGNWPRRNAAQDWKSSDPCSGYSGAGQWP